MKAMRESRLSRRNLFLSSIAVKFDLQVADKGIDVRLFFDRNMS
jgi:hypothetical protein